MRATLMLLAVAIGAGPATAQAGQAVIDQTRAFHATGSFRIMLMDGSVSVRGWDRDSVRVTGRLDAAARAGFYFGASASGTGKLGVETGRGGHAELEIALPVGAHLWVKTGGAPIEVIGIAGATDLYSVTGDIRVEASPTSLYAESMGGDIRVSGEPQVARVRTGAGSLTIRGGGADLSLRSVNGGITVAGSSPLRRVHVETVSGAVRIDAQIDRAGSLVVNSHDGPVEIALPASTDADFLVATLEGRLDNELTSGGVRKRNGLDGRELSFSSGAGGTEVTVRTFSGSVTIRPRGGS